MLIIRKEQMDIFRQAAAKRFEDEMVAHSLSFSPQHCTAIGETQVRLAVSSAIVRAGSYGFDNRGPLRLFIEIMYLFGSAFDTDPQYPWAAAILRDTSDQMERAEQLYEQVLNYQNSVSETGAMNTRQALTRLSFLPRQSLTFSADDFVTAMLREMTYIFPEKAAYIGDEALKAIISESCALAQNALVASPRSCALISVLMYACGHGCADDPLFPWISKALKDGVTADPAARTDRLGEAALAWLDYTLPNTFDGVRS